MTPTVTVVGSGASGVHFALTLLRKGLSVRMIDVGRRAASSPLPDATLGELKSQLADPARYFLGDRFQAVLLPAAGQEYYGLPPSKDYVFDPPRGFGAKTEGFSPLFSFAEGGLAQAWTAGCYPFNDDELAAFPFAPGELTTCYEEVARRIGITGVDDDLARFMPVHGHLQPPLVLDRHSERLLESYRRVRSRLNGAGVYLGRTRVATLTQPMGARRPCDYLGRCLWGCPRAALYTPSCTLDECRAFPGFEYLSGFDVRYLRLGDDGVGRGLVAQNVGTGAFQDFAVDQVALAAGALITSRIVLESLQRAGGGRLRLAGLMDTPQVLMPFVNLGLVGRRFAAEAYQYHLLGMGLVAETPRDYIHGQVTTLKTALLHPLIQRVPLDLRTSTVVMRSIHSALGLLNLNFSDARRDTCYVELTDESTPRVALHYTPDTGDEARIADGIARARRALWQLGCLVLPGMVHVRPMGASVHYAGTLPMTADAAALTATPDGRSRDVANLWLVDGATFPFLPAKNITLTLMANAVRIAEAGW